MCVTNGARKTSPNGNPQQSNMYPDLGEFTRSPDAGTNPMQPPIMQLLQALGLVPPGGFDTRGTDATPSAPPAADNANENAGGESTARAGQTNEGTSTGQQQQACGGWNCPSGAQSCPNCHHNPSTNAPWSSAGQPSAPWWANWPQSSCSQRRSSNGPYANCEIARFFSNAWRVMKQVFVTSTRLSSFFFILLLIHVLAPAALLQNVVFMLLAAGLGLHLPTLAAGQLLWAGVTCLRVFEPVFLAGMFLFAVHKMVVRREPLFDTDYWNARFGNLRLVINENFRQ